MSRFYAKDGLCFSRLEGGSVLIETIEPKGDITANPALTSVTLSPEAWASVVASMSAAGETGDTWRVALAAQKWPES